MTDIKIGEITKMPISKRATINNVWVTGRVFCKKYVGKFKNESLQALADTDQWHTGIWGLAESIRGYGHSPEYAIRDAISRNEDMIKKLTKANEFLEAALKNDK